MTWFTHPPRSTSYTVKNKKKKKNLSRKFIVSGVFNVLERIPRDVYLFFMILERMLFLLPTNLVVWDESCWPGNWNELPNAVSSVINGLIIGNIQVVYPSRIGIFSQFIPLSALEHGRGKLVGAYCTYHFSNDLFNHVVVQLSRDSLLFGFDNGRTYTVIVSFEFFVFFRKGKTK